MTATPVTSHLFQLLEPTQAKMTSFLSRAEQHGDEPATGVTFGLSITGPNALMDLLSKGLKDVFYRFPDTMALPEVEDLAPLLRTRVCERVKLKLNALEGWRVVIEHGIDDSSAIDLHGCKISKFFVEPFEGGSCQIDFQVSTNDVDEIYLGALGMKIGRQITLTILAPEPKVEEDPKPSGVIDGSVGAFNADHPDATDLFAGGAGGYCGDRTPDGGDDDDDGWRPGGDSDSPAGERTGDEVLHG